MAVTHGRCLRNIGRILWDHRASNSVVRERVLAESTKPGIGLISKPIITSEDATIRFIKLKDDFNKIQLNQRLILLKQLNHSRTIELFYLNKQINEFKLHYEHLQRIDSLLPSIEAGCFYTGKGIEGDQYERRNS
ncbi:unnamed protein product [Schistosoma mattheei]|uniref:Uncharacterized protein n=1 Tax=Schistosoma mattheei TaxID=31246 RepID=A0A183PUW8_9TREM|nr:unnamed protein product [Schistosoma mattheei]